MSNANATTAPSNALDNAEKKHSQWGDVWKRLRKNRLGMVGLCIILVMILSAVAAPLLTRYDYGAQDIANRLKFPSMEHIMGTDNFGRDIFARCLYGGRISLLVSLTGVCISLLLGGTFGAISGYFGGKIENIIMRLMDVLQAIPGMLMAVALSAMLGAGIFNTAIAVSIGGIGGMSRMLRATALTVREQEYVEAARAGGSGHFRTIIKHVVPNCLAPMIVNTTLALGGNIMQISSLSFIGLGIQPPTPEWGSMLNAGRGFIRDFWPLITFPGVCIVLTMFGFNVLGDGLRDALDPKLKQ